MKCRSTILIACGWFLMVPPTDNKMVYDDLPISKWTHLTSFDTARECENSRVALQQEYKKKQKQVEERAIILSRCLTSDSFPVK
jgi:hypothetical protein